MNMPGGGAGSWELRSDAKTSVPDGSMHLRSIVVNGPVKRYSRMALRCTKTVRLLKLCAKNRFPTALVYSLQDGQSEIPSEGHTPKTSDIAIGLVSVFRRASPC